VFLKILFVIVVFGVLTDSRIPMHLERSCHYLKQKHKNEMKQLLRGVVTIGIYILGWCPASFGLMDSKSVVALCQVQKHLITKHEAEDGTLG
jgi:hypothetical protein